MWSTLDPWLCDLLSCAICSWAVRSVFPLGRPNRQPSHGILTHSCKAKQFGGRTWTFPPLCGKNGESFGAYVTFDFWALFFVCLNDFFFTSVPSVKWRWWDKPSVKRRLWDGYETSRRLTDACGHIYKKKESLWFFVSLKREIHAPLDFSVGFWIEM